jgi:hypothetical protein
MANDSGLICAVAKSGATSPAPRELKMSRKTNNKVVRFFGDAQIRARELDVDWVAEARR